MEARRWWFFHLAVPFCVLRLMGHLLYRCIWVLLWIFSTSLVARPAGLPNRLAVEGFGHCFSESLACIMDEHRVIVCIDSMAMKGYAGFDSRFQNSYSCCVRFIGI